MNICKICNKEYNDLVGLGVHIKMSHHISTHEYYDKFLKQVDNKCKTCGQPTNFLTLSKGYREYCSVKCVSNNREIIKQKIQNTDYVKSRIKAAQTCLEKYGVSNATKLKTTQEKMQDTCLHKYGVSHSLQSEQFKSKYMNTCLEKYDTTNPNNAQDIKDKKRRHFLEKYNSPSPFGNKEVQLKSQQTLLSNYGVKTPMTSIDIQEKFKSTCLERYGVDNPSKLSSIKVDIQSKALHAAYVKLIQIFPDYEPLFSEMEYTGCGQSYNWKCKKCHTTFMGRTANRFVLYCPKCDSEKSGTLESQIYKILHSLKITNILLNKRTILPSKLELDYYLPDHNIAIEFNGNYWHSEISGKKSRSYHVNKLKECEKLGINLLQITEDEWQNKQKIVIDRLRNLLGKTKYSIYGRNCTIKTIDSTLKNKFLNKYHIQGEDKSTINLGLFFNNRLVSVMTFSKRRKALGALHKTGHYELSRFCNINNFNILGGASKLLAYFEKTYNPIQIVSYADRRWSRGNMYIKLGFQLTHISQPNYWYTFTYLERIHRFNFRKNILSNKVNIFDENKSEWENMQTNGYDRIWDCGNLVFVKNYLTKR